MEKTNIEANERYQRALRQAYADGVAIKARVTDKKTGALLGFLVSGKNGAEYRVNLNGNALHCNCKAGQKGEYCKHRAFCTHHEIERKAAADKAAKYHTTCDFCGKECHTDDSTAIYGWICDDCRAKPTSQLPHLDSAAMAVMQGNQAVHTMR